MCMIDGADGEARVSESTMRRAAKSHRCGECGRTIERGEVHEYASMLWDDGVAEWHHHRTCAHCIAARHWLLVQCDGWCYSMVREDLEEHWNEDITLRTVSLGRLIVGMRRGWKRLTDDRLMPVPLHA
jgi:hypothetical protein